MAEREKKRRRRSELEQFSPTADGTYVYTGDYMVFDGSATLCRRAAIGTLASAGGVFLLLLAAGFLPVGGMRGSFYVLLPYAGGLIAAGMALYAAVRVAAGGRTLRTYLYEKTVPCIPRRAMTAAVLAVLAGLGEGLHMALVGPPTALDGLFLALTLGAAACGVLLWRTGRKQMWKKQEKK